MPEDEPIERIGAQIVWIGLAFMACAVLFTWAECTFVFGLPRPSLIAWRQVFCPANAPDYIFPVSNSRLIVSKLFAFWVFALGTTIFGLVRLWLERRPEVVPAVVARVEVSRFGKRNVALPPPPTLLLPAEYIMTHEAREALARAIASACAVDDLATARALLGEAITASGDLELQMAMAEADRATLDWPRIAAEAIEADSHTRSRGEPGCDSIAIELGNETGRRTLLTRTYRNAAAPKQNDLVKYWAHVEPMEIEGTGALVALENSSEQPGESMDARATRSALATKGIVLSFFAAVERHAATDGLPLAARVRAEIRYFNGPEAMFQIGPAISFETEADRVAPGAAVEEAAAALHARQAKAHLDATARLLDHMRRSYARAQYVPTRGLPEELGETLVQLRQIEDRLIQDDLGGTTRPAEFQEILERVRAIREAQAPPPLDLGPYRTVAAG